MSAERSYNVDVTYDAIFSRFPKMSFSDPGLHRLSGQPVMNYLWTTVFLFTVTRKLILKLLLSGFLLPGEQPYRQVYQQFLTQHVLNIAHYHSNSL